MSVHQQSSACREADRLYRALIATHSPLAAALITAAVTGRWPAETPQRNSNGGVSD